MLCFCCCFSDTVWLLWWCGFDVGFVVVVIVLLFLCFGFLVGLVFYYNDGDCLLLFGCLCLVVVGVCFCSLSHSCCCRALVALFSMFVVLLFVVVVFVVVLSVGCCGGVMKNNNELWRRFRSGQNGD